MNLLPLDPQYNQKVNKPACKGQALPDNNNTLRSHTVPSNTNGGSTSKNFANYLFPSDMGACKNGNQSECYKNL